MRQFIIAAALVLAGCQAAQSPTVASTETPDERKAREICESIAHTDANYGGGMEGGMRSCMVLRLREIRAGLR